MNDIAKQYLKLAEYIQDSDSDQLTVLDHVNSVHMKISNQISWLYSSVKKIKEISVHCDQTENCRHIVTLNDGSKQEMSPEEICKFRNVQRILGGYHLKYICQWRDTLPKKKIKQLSHTTQDSLPTTSGVIFADDTSAILWGPQIYWLCHQFGTDLLTEEDQIFLEEEFSFYYKNTDLFVTS